ncbi:MAG TPA: hypothetical protein VMU09_13430 [Acidimicrobiales bacterium]|nr:hypothetical protein [Acidimicrobiales bacterium]
MTPSQPVSSAPGAEGDGPEGLALAVPEEPEALRRQVLATVLDGAALGERLRGDGGIGPWLWARWQDRLEPAGIGSEAFLDVVEGYQREIWFWLLEDRGWSPMVAGLSGRLARRVPALPA